MQHIYTVTSCHQHCNFSSSSSSRRF